MLLKRSLLLVAITLITSQAMALGQEMICQIKYGEKDLDKKYMTFPFLLLKLNSTSLTQVELTAQQWFFT